MGTLGRYRTPSATRLLHHVLASPALVAAVRELPPPALAKLIDSIGLESAGELVALATTSQLERVFDEDLWQSDAVGDDPHFDPERFATWLEVLLEAGEPAVVRRLCELPLDFVVLAVQRSIFVFDKDRLGMQLAEDPEELEAIEKALDSHPCEEWEELMLVARDPRTWDSVLTALMALDRDHHSLLRRILDRCADACAEHIDDNGGLYDVLSRDELLEVDEERERDERRASEGYVAPSDARSFLTLARQTPAETNERDAVTRAYFRELDRHASERRRERPRPAAVELMRLLAAATEADSEAASKGALASATARAMTPASGTLPAAARRARAHAEPPSSALAPAEPESLLARALGELAEADPEVHAERLDELAYLANVLVAGEPNQERQFRPIEALEMAASVCDEALLRELSERNVTDVARLAAARELLRTRHLDLLFRAGWHARRPGNRERASLNVPEKEYPRQS
jgi:hypothetical protein